MTENEMDRPIDIETARNRVMGDMDFLKEMLLEFEGSITTFLDAIRDALARRDASALSQTAHQFKGVALNLSIPRIAQKAADLDELGKTADFDNSEIVLKALESAVSEFKEFMLKWPW